MNSLQYIFVHGLSGWGSYDAKYQKLPYWGMHGGELMNFLTNEGFESYAASVAPTGSAWDRACELYAQLAGTKVDYGEHHSRKYRHERYGRDFSDCPLIPTWDDNTRLVLIGHSFGGTTIRLFSELLVNGDEDERKTTKPDEISPLFQGGTKSRIHSLVTLASPMNGTTAYEMGTDPDFNADSVKRPLWSKLLARMMAKSTKIIEDGRDPRDYAGYDMHLDRAREINERIQTQPMVYYFSVPCCITDKLPDGTCRPRREIEPMIASRSYLIGAYSGKTAGGITVDAAWHENDGLVNTISAMAPEGAPYKALDKENIEHGIWNVFPTLQGDHMWLQGGLMRQHNIRPFYQELLTMISQL